MSMSFPSRRITVGDVPEVHGFRTTFVYNFFTPNERLAGRDGDAFDVPERVRRLPAESFDSARIDDVSRVVPRFVKFDFVPVVSQRTDAQNEFVTVKQDPGRGAGSITTRQSTKIRDHVGRPTLQSETDFSNRSFTPFDFQDEAIDQRLKLIVSGTVAKRITSHNRNVQDQIEDQRDLIIATIGSEHSLMDAAKALLEQSSGGVTDNMVVESLAKIDNLRLQFIDEAGERAIVDDAFDRIRNVSIKAQFNNKVVGRVVQNVANDPLSIFHDEFIPIQGAARQIEERARTIDDSNVMSDDEYETLFEAIDVVPIDVQDVHVRTEIVGYIVEKHELLEGNPRPVEHKPIVLENPDISTAVDINVKYGGTYVYTIRAVARIETKSIVEGTLKTVVSVGLVSSRKSPRALVRCIEDIPPPPPADFNVVWSHRDRAPLLTWNMPVNRQRDVKRFQVFRRASAFEPFQLIREFNFDDSAVKTEDLETPDRSLIQTSDGPVLQFIDREFGKESRAIYAVCSIDAHSLSSNYSAQLEVTFDHSSNRIRKRLVSVSGAMKAYPNLLLNEDMFVDTIKDSGHSRCRIYYDPEYLMVSDRDGNDMGLLVVREPVATAAEPQVPFRGEYRLQFINVDLAKQEVVTVGVDDRRATRMKVPSSRRYPSLLAPQRIPRLSGPVGRFTLK